MSNELKNLDDHKNQLAKQLRKERKVRMKRSAAIKAVAEANAALDAHFKYWAAPGFLQSFDPEAAASVEQELEYHLAIELNNLCYIDQEVADDYGSVEIIKCIEAEWAARKRAAQERSHLRRTRNLLSSSTTD